MSKENWSPNLSLPLAELMAQVGEEVRSLLERELPARWRGSRKHLPAARYSLLAGGKRIRPLLVILCAYAPGVPRVKGKQVLAVAVAVEMIHTYSLIHDDLPCMDNDSLRRGLPTCHVVFGPDAAVRAGGSLLAQAFVWLGVGFGGEEAFRRASAILARGAGFWGMVGGQWLDSMPTAPKAFWETHPRKTGALMAASCRLGGLLCTQSDQAQEALATYGACVGEAFQAVDDLLDATGDRSVLGKGVGKDAALGRPTVVGALGLEGARNYARGKVEAALEALAGLPGPSVPLLRQLAWEILHRST